MSDLVHITLLDLYTQSHTYKGFKLYCRVYRDKGVRGNAVTPFLLRTVDELLGGKALTASILSSLMFSVYICLLSVQSMHMDLDRLRDQ